jgi:hypothetical protein
MDLDNVITYDDNGKEVQTTVKNLIRDILIYKKNLERLKENNYINVWYSMGRKIGEDFQPTIPKTTKEIYDKYIIPALHRCGAIPKKDLIVGKQYKGYCRNASEAIWLGEQFEYDRYKWGSTFKEKINHFEDDNGYDLFVPYQIL